MRLWAWLGWLFAADHETDQQDEDAWLRDMNTVHVGVTRDDELADLRDQVIGLAADNLRLRLQLKRLPTPDWSRFSYLADRHAEVVRRRAGYGPSLTAANDRALASWRECGRAWGLDLHDPVTLYIMLATVHVVANTAVRDGAPCPHTSEVVVSVAETLFEFVPEEATT